MIVPLPRIVRNGDDGTDIHGHKRAVTRLLRDMTLEELESKPSRVRDHFGEAFETRVNVARKKVGLVAKGIVDEKLYEKLRSRGCYDAYALSLVNKWAAAHPPLTLCFPIPSNVFASVCQGLHETAGLAGNWAIDFCAGPGAAVVAVENATVLRLSGSDPDDDTPDPAGTYGWSIQLITRHGYHYFVTHLGKRGPQKVGEIVRVGDPIGYVGDQDFRPDHTHYGVSSPLGETDARKRITAVSKSPRITL